MHINIQAQSLNLPQSVLEACRDFKCPTQIEFGKVKAPAMITCDYSEGKWGEINVLPYGPLSLDPFTKVLHYGQEIFEGMKAYKSADTGEIALFRPEENYKRLMHSARRMAIPEMPESIFMAMTKTLVALCQNFIPTGLGQSLYLRPFIYASDTSLGIRPSLNFKFVVVASPSASYFSADEVKVLIEKRHTRAAPGGTGSAKTGGNYAASLLSAQETIQKGFHQTMWLDSSKNYIEELSGMNVFFLIENELYTPTLTDTILKGITRDSVIQIAKLLGYKVHETRLNYRDILSQIASGKCTEAFACGTAAIIAPITSLAEESPELKNYEFRDNKGKVSLQIREKLLKLQAGVEKLPTELAHWRVPVEKLNFI